MNNRYLLTFERAFIVLGIIFFTNSLPPGIFPRSFISLLRYFIWFGSTLFICLRWQTTWAVAKRGKLVWIVTGLSVLSALWSANPAYTKIVVREVLQMSTFGLYFASRFKLREQLSLLAVALGIAAFLSALLAIAIPAMGIARGKFSGAWIGVYNHKNSLGKYMSLSVIIFCLLVAEKQFRAKKIYQFWIWSGLLLSLGLVILSTSKTGLAVSVVSLALLYSYRLYQKQGNKRRLYLEISILLSLLAFIVIASSWGMLKTSLDRDITLTGRTDIWGVAIPELLNNNPLLGFGRGAFWAPGSHLAEVAGAAVGNKYIPPHAHNGYIDLALEIGLVGLLCFVSSFLLVFKDAITRSFVSRTAKDLWPVVLLSWLTLYNFTESSLMHQTNVFWPLYISAALCAKPTGRVIKLRRLPQQPEHQSLV